MHLLLVEDDLDLGTALQRSLNAQGYACTWVRSIRDARAHTGEAREGFDCVVLDLGLLRRYQEQRSADHVKRTQRDAQEPNRFQGPQQGQDSSKLPKLTVSSVARRLILEGLTNEQVWGQLKTGFKLDDSKKHYPSWYRAQLKRDGKLEA